MNNPSAECLLFLKKMVPPENFDRFLEACGIFGEILYETNKTLNLTRIPESDFWSKHVADSVAIASILPQKDDLDLCDVGCGAGFPSLPLAAAFPGIRITSVDSTRKKIGFVQDAVDAMKLDNVEALQARANELGHEEDYKQRFDLVTARAVSDALTLRREVSGLLKKQGLLYIYRTTEQRDKELPELKKLHIPWQCTPEFELPDQGGTRLFMLLKRGAK